MKKKLLPILLTFALALALLPSALAAETIPVTWLPEGMVAQAYLESTDRFLVSRGEGSSTTWSIVDMNGNVVQELGNTGYDTAYGFEDGLAEVSMDFDKSGFIDETGKLVIPMVYDGVMSFTEGLCAVMIGEWGSGKWGYVNKQGQLVIAQEYDFAYPFSEGLARVEKSGKKGYIDTTGKTVIPMVYDSASEFSNGVAVVGVGSDWESRKYGLIDKTGQMIVPIEYDYLYTFDGVLFAAEKNDKIGFIDATGKTIYPFVYDDWVEADTGHGVFSEGFAALYDSDGNTYYINGNGQMVGQTYDFGRDFSGGMAYVEQNGRHGFIDATGNVAFYLDIPAGRELIVSGLYGPWFGDDGLAQIFTVPTEVAEELAFYDIRCGAVNKSGELVLPYEYEEIAVFGSAGYVEDANGRYGLFRNPYAASQPVQPAQPAEPAQPSAPAAPAAPATATPTASTVLVNGANTAFDAYNIGGANYFKLRDLAYVLNGTAKQFSVDWDASANAISLTAGQPYAAVGGEMTAGTGAVQTATPTSSKILLNGAEVALEAYNIGGNNYFKLRDLGSAFNFGVDWDGTINTIVIDTNKGYTA